MDYQQKMVQLNKYICLCNCVLKAGKGRQIAKVMWLRLLLSTNSFCNIQVTVPAVVK